MAETKKPAGFTRGGPPKASWQGRSEDSPTPHQRQAHFLAARFGLAPLVAAVVAEHAFARRAAR